MSTLTLVWLVALGAVVYVAVRLATSLVSYTRSV
jgi:hypothetical protein